jgi:ribonucleoside-diphosphate reductase alpha chain
MYERLKVVDNGAVASGAKSVATGGSMAQLFSAGATALKAEPNVGGKVEAAQPVETKPKSNVVARIAEARMKGYEGEACTECGNFTMVRNGTCLKCDTCGGTSGCS